MIKNISAKSRSISFLITALLTGSFCFAQQEIPLYTGKIPNATGAANEENRKANELVDSLTFNVSVPTLTVFLPPKDKANGTAVIICPGGGYHVLLTKREGTDVARTFNKLGVTAFVLKYRLPDNKTMKDKSIGPLQDAQRAIQLVRQKAGQWNIDPQKIGIMGFSAGGHLASTAGTHYREALIENTKGVSLRPDFMLLINPVISFTDSIGHTGSRNNLLGDAPTEKQICLYSNELQVDKTTPPSFLVHSNADSVVPVANSLSFYSALQHNGVTTGLHIYAKGEHGFLTAPSFDEWFGRCIYWMKEMELMP
ncbi:alpha/beta hydrolase [Agriterribacter sp.]|uniref:alpha/beta hydrolase n=1 Tax=Agriterribacter sp. TaxID=2821509 RepID=UPI002C71EAA2|nr:alpha/beta hydrolase [Agriterribacter sp.]HTN05880.1 alpha/beta hydrolase [Agriterribacter sp.]